MNEELAHQVALLVGNLNAALTGAGHIVTQQLPVALEGYVTYGIVSTSILILVSALVFVGMTWIVFRKAIPMIKTNEDAGVPAVIFSVPIAVVAFLFMISRITTLALIIWAPQIWLVEQALRILK